MKKLFVLILFFPVLIHAETLYTFTQSGWTQFQFNLTDFPLCAGKTNLKYYVPWASGQGNYICKYTASAYLGGSEVPGTHKTQGGEYLTLEVGGWYGFGGGYGFQAWITGEDNTQYVLSIEINPSGSGTCSGAGSYSPNAVVTCTAVPSEGYIFNGFTFSSGGSSSNPYDVTMTSDITITANFVPSGPVGTYTLTVNGGVTSGNFQSGTVCNISPTVPAGKTFLKWTVTGCVLNLADTVANNNITMPSNNCSALVNFTDGTTGGGGDTGTGDMDNDVPAINNMSALLHGDLSSIISNTDSIRQTLEDFAETETDNTNNIGENTVLIYDKTVEIHATLNDINQSLLAVGEKIDTTNSKLDTLNATGEGIAATLLQISLQLSEQKTGNVEQKNISKPELDTFAPLELEANTPSDPLLSSEFNPVAQKVKTAIESVQASAVNEPFVFVVPFSKISDRFDDKIIKFTSDGDYPVLNEIRLMIRAFFTICLWAGFGFQWFALVSKLFL